MNRGGIVRKVIQIGSSESGVCALCDDGTMWALAWGAGKGWQELEPIPQPEAGDKIVEFTVSGEFEEPLKPESIAPYQNIPLGPVMQPEREEEIPFNDPRWTPPGEGWIKHLAEHGDKPIGCKWDDYVEVIFSDRPREFFSKSGALARALNWEQLPDRSIVPRFYRIKPNTPEGENA